MKKLLMLGILCCLGYSSWVSAGPGHTSGKISNITVTSDGVMVMMNSGIPDNCEGTPAGWMLAKQEYTALNSVLLAAWATGKTSGVVYTFGREGGTGFCLISQFDPSGEM